MTSPEPGPPSDFASPKPRQEHPPLHRLISEALLAEIKAGTYRPGDRLPSETVLCERFDTSRITVAKAIQSLQRDGLVSRRAGSGTYVEAHETDTRHQFGLLIPELGTTEIFEPICQGIMRSPLAKSHSLLWGHAPSAEEGAELTAQELCHEFIDQNVAGVFFAPLEFTEQKDLTNRKVVAALQQANIPVVLLDRCFETFPRRSDLDLVGIDNQRAGYLLTQHLWQQGARRIAFVARERSANTMTGRISGYSFALSEFHSPTPPAVHLGDAADLAFVRSVLAASSPDAVICGNDLTAAALMRSLIELGVRVPESVRIVGIDDVAYAKFLPVPLTTVHQYCDEIGRAAMGLMRARLREPTRPGIDLRVRFDLVVRNSCGAGLPLSTS